MPDVFFPGEVVLTREERRQLGEQVSAPSSTDDVFRAVERMITLSGGPKFEHRVEQLGEPAEEKTSSSVSVTWGILSTIGMAASAYHGYKRNDSVGWAVAWGVLGGLFPIITVPVALAQGYGKPAGTRDNPEPFAEVGRFEHEGRVYEAGGAYYDRERGVLAGYPQRRLDGKHVLARWDGGEIAPLTLVSSRRTSGFYGAPVTMYYWSAVYDGRVFSGRNSGPGMFLRMRAGRSAR